jgi:hypothetical protein
MDHLIDPSSVDSIIARLVASYQQPTAPAPLVAVRHVKGGKAKAEKVSKVKDLASLASDEPNADGSQIAPATAALPPVSAPLPTGGTIDAKQFVIASRRAKTREERIQAIAGFVGYNSSELYSVNELRANLAAQRALRGAPAPLSQPIHSIRPTLSGYVSGTPDMLAKRQADLTGRAVLAVETQLDLEREARTHLSRGDMANATQVAVLAKVEQDRLRQISQDLERL